MHPSVDDSASGSGRTWLASPVRVARRYHVPSLSPADLGEISPGTGS